MQTTLSSVVIQGAVDPLTKSLSLHDEYIVARASRFDTNNRYKESRLFKARPL